VGPGKPRSPLARYAVAVAAAGASLAVREAIAAWIGSPGVYVAFYPAVVLAATVGGLGPGLVATALSAVASVVWALPPHGAIGPLSPTDAAGLALFVAGGAFTAILAHHYHAAERQLAELERRAALRDAEERLRATAAESLQNRAQLRAVFESMRDGVVVFDMTGRVVLVNEAEARISGYATAEEMKRDVGHFLSVFELWGPDGRVLPADAWPIARVLRGETISEVELRGRRRDTGQEWIFTFSGAPVLDERGEQVLGLVVTRDSTARRAAEEALRDADRRKDEFLGVLSHELRNPLAPIRNSLHVLDRAAPGSEHGRRARSVIGRQVQHLARLVDDLLDVTRISRGKVQLLLVRLELWDLVARTVEDHRHLLLDRGIELLVDPPGRPLYVSGDATRLAQLVGNLLQNAAKFTPAGGRVTVSLREEEGRAVLRVRDTGAGIAPDMLGRIFQPFTQADRTLDRSAGGLGLGLALVRGLAELHGGDVAAASEGVGRGAELTVRLPLAPPPEETAPPPRLKLVRPSVRRVLVIEDNVDAAESLKAALELAGHSVSVAFTGPEGLERARALSPDVVLCDIGLPGLDGYGVARALRADPALHGLPLFALTGYALAEDQRRAAEAGFDRHLAKPADLELLQRLLAELPDRHAA
jgi:two-component system CheB/CheR fusion protein